MAALRLLSTGVLIGLAWALALVLTIVPAAVVRRAAQTAQKSLCRLTCKSLGIAVESSGELPTGAPILVVANHISWTDIIALGSLSPLVFVARHDLAGWPVLGTLARAYGALFVERGRRRLIRDVNRQMASKMAESHVVALFPEATTGDGTRLRRFHSPHFAAASDLLSKDPSKGVVLVVPVAIAYTRRRGLPLGRTGRASIAWYGDTTFAPHLLDLTRGGSVTCQVRILDPIAFDRNTNRKTVARTAAEAIRIAFLGEVLAVPGNEAASYVLSRRQAV